MAIRAICTADPYAWIDDPNTELYPERADHGSRPGRKKLKVRKGEIVEFPSEEAMPQKMQVVLDNKGNSTFDDNGQLVKKVVGISHFKILTGTSGTRKKKFESVTDQIDRLRREIGMSPAEFEEYLSARTVENEQEVLSELTKTLANM